KSAVLLKDIDAILAITKEERESANKAIADQQANRQMIMQVIEYGTAAEFLFLLIFFLWFRQDTENRFHRLIQNSDLLTNRQPLLPLLGSSDEIGEIDMSLHQIAMALQQSQQREQATIEHARDLICKMDEQLYFTQSNQAVLDLLHYKPHQFIGKDLASIVHATDVERVEAQFRQNRTEQEMPFEARLVRKDGRAIDTLWSVRWSSRDQSFICVVHDITIQKQAERFRQEVVQMVSHDLKTPLFTVSSFLEMAEGGMFGTLAEAGQETISTAFKGCAQMLALIRDLLDIEKIKAGMLQINPQTEELADVLSDACDQVKESAAAHNIQVKRQSTNIQVLADRERIIQIITNLLNQAIGSSPSGSSVVIRSAEDNHYTQIDIEDGGSAPSDEVLQAMFAGFQTIDGAQSERQALELPISQALVEVHGGTVKATRRGTNCLFTVRLPRKAVRV
ncbi:MAG TPA: PAS domain-containing sensor histidine kinase, partial [Chroococcales cyanobacterium]